MTVDHDKLPDIPVFKYIPDGDFFIADQDYAHVCDLLELGEWNRVVWIGRLFTMDNDFGEHWFDNGEELEEKEKIAENLGLGNVAIYVIDPKRFQDGRDGPCHTDAFRKQFWTDVLTHLKLNLGTLIEKAIAVNEQQPKEDRMPDLDECIVDLIRTYAPNYDLIIPPKLTQAGIDRALVEEVTENLDSGMKVYIEKNTKKIRCLPANDLFFEAELWQDEIDAIDAGDFWEVTPMQSFQSYKIMEDYIPLVEDQQLSNRLAQAIDKRKPFRHFKAIIDDSGVYGNRWFEFKTKRYAEYVVNELIGLISR